MTVRKAAGDVYAATIDDKIAMKIGPGDWWVAVGSWDGVTRGLVGGGWQVGGG